MLSKKALVLLVVLLAGQELFTAEEVKPESDRLRKVLEKSLVFPGLGQLAEKQYVKAAVFASAEIFCLARIVIEIGKGAEAYRNYRDAKDALAATEWRLQTEKYDRRRNTAILAAAGVWVLNMIDIFVFAKKKYGRNAAVTFHPYYNHENQTFGAGLTCCF
ncbi:MAG: hypothetical protein IH584_05800 [Candidatus Aminicenantes bacterium]|nr:hypothetical protein [Candidatus Aminicenantes bacterium]